MVLYLTEADVNELVGMPDALTAVRAVTEAHGLGRAANQPRQRATVGDVTLCLMGGAWTDGEVLGTKTYVTGAGARFWVQLFDARGNLLALLEGDRLGQLRTGAATGVATEALARNDSRTLAVLGAGYQAWTQVEAVLAVRPVQRVRVWSRTGSRAAEFAARVKEAFGVTGEAMPDAQAAVDGADMVVTVTASAEPVLHGEWLTPGVHVTLAGSNHPAKRESDAEVFRRATLVTTDDVTQARIESGDLLGAVADQAIGWDAVVSLGEVLTGKRAGRTGDDDITLFCSHGVGSWDLALAATVYRRARAEGRGITLPFSGAPVASRR
jgi:ornithine cyclodeaminase/alanine dehydrogenase